mmetsp:Transcript_42541/g.101006  ORF Transcript_42541/g.101006 Transcript_42541/m.101006 type:complete len:116 (-) Transcript_42541:38-385(-)
MRVVAGRPFLGELFGWLKAEKSEKAEKAEKAEKEKGKEDYPDVEVDGDKVIASFDSMRVERLVTVQEFLFFFGPRGAKRSSNSSTIGTPHGNFAGKMLMDNVLSLPPSPSTPFSP